MVWILVLFMTNGTVSSVPGFVAKMDCDKAGADLVAFARAEKLPVPRFTCVEQPRTR